MCGLCCRAREKPGQGMMGFMEPSADFLAARTVVNREDPLGLLDGGAPEDEYDSEVRDLVKSPSALTAGQVSGVFLHWFGESGAMPPEMAARIADGINQARAVPRQDDAER
jgi:hypothetical protein